MQSGAYVSNLDPKDKEAAKVLPTGSRVLGLPRISPLHAPNHDGHPAQPNGANDWEIGREALPAINGRAITEVEAGDTSITFWTGTQTVAVRSRE